MSKEGIPVKLNIAIVDDLKSDADRLRQTVAGWEPSCAGEIEIGRIECFAGGEELLAHFERGAFHLVFLDICMDRLNGIETAKRLREIDSRVLIVFVTTSDEFAFQAFPVHAFDYVIKPYAAGTLHRVLNEAVPHLGIAEPFFTIRHDRTASDIPASSIVAAVSCGHSVEIFLDAGASLNSGMTFAEVEALFGTDPRFLTCNRGLIINMEHVATVENGAFVMKNGQSWPIRVRGRAQLMEQFAQYQIARLRGSFVTKGERP